MRDEKPGMRPVPANLRTSLLYGPDGNVCVAVVADCTELVWHASQRLEISQEQIAAMLDHRHRRALVHEVADSLVPPGTRGARQPTGKYSVGGCINERDEEYENVSIDFNDNDCGDNFARITWKGHGCDLAGTVNHAIASFAQGDVCGYSFYKLLREHKDEASILNVHAAVLERLGSQLQDVKLREALVEQYTALRNQAKFMMKSAEEFTPK